MVALTPMKYGQSLFPSASRWCVLGLFLTLAPALSCAELYVMTSGTFTAAYLELKFAFCSIARMASYGRFVRGRASDSLSLARPPPHVSRHSCVANLRTIRNASGCRTTMA